jgi:hypothetical protein
MCVLGLQTSHLLFICTNLGYGTVLTAACACQGRSAVVWFDLVLVRNKNILLCGYALASIPKMEHSHFLKYYCVF